MKDGVLDAIKQNVYDACALDTQTFSTAVKSVTSIMPLSHSTAITRRWHGGVKFLRAPRDRRKMHKIVAYYFPFSHRGDVTASLRRLWRFYGDSTECYRVPAEL